MQTQHVHNLLPDFVNKTLDNALHHEVSEHLDACPECRAEAERVGEVFRSIQSLQFEQPPVGYFSNVLPRIRERAEHDERFAWLKNPLLVKFAAPLAAVFVLVSLANLVSFDQSSEEYITYDDVADVLVRQTEGQPFANDQVELFAASALPEETVEHQITGLLVANGDTFSFDDLAGTSTDLLLENLSEQEVEALLQRLEEGSLSL
ncbi:MAG: zf-HC2 domain-containing protein [Ignavibacteriae bacterium]|nr:zf-HC2 domain-containing protein [Ignavibacteriota bacterium]